MNKPAEFMCSMYRLQNRFRKADFVGREQLKSLLPALDMNQHLPIVRMALHMTHLLLNPVWGSAYYLLYDSIHRDMGASVSLTPRQRSCGQ